MRHARPDRTRSIRFDRLIDERADLITQNAGLMTWAINRYGPNYADVLRDDEIHDACVAGMMAAAAKSLTSSKSSQITAWASSADGRMM